MKSGFRRFLISTFLLFWAPLGNHSHVGKIVRRSTFIGKAIFEWDWDERNSTVPPKRENIQLYHQHHLSTSSKRAVFDFFAFGKRWRMDLRRNTILLSSSSRFDIRLENGTVVHSSSFPGGDNNCMWIGTVEAGPLESGMAAFSTCNDMRGMLTTNLNDYVIQPSGLHGGIVKAGYVMGQYEQRSGFHQSLNFDDNPWGNVRPLKRLRYEPTDDVAREQVVETAVIVDKEYVDQWRKDFPTAKGTFKDISLWITDSLNWMQMWYIHPTLGYRKWFHLTQFIWLPEAIDYSPYPGYNGHDHLNQICNWQASVFNDSKSWDYLLYLSGKPYIFGDRDDGSEFEGLALLGGNCFHRRHCVGVRDQNFQWSVWTRLLAHETGHAFGMEDDYWGESAEYCLNGLMRRGAYQNFEWAKCSVENYEDWHKSFPCLKTSPTLGADAAIPEVESNVAFRARAQQSSTFISEMAWGAHKAVDGPLIGVLGEGPELGSCTQTQLESNPWLRVELAPEFWSGEIRRIRIFNREDCCDERLRDFDVRIGNNSDISKNPLCFRWRGGVPGKEGGAAVLSCERQMAGRYVSVQIRGHSQILTICEIQIFQVENLSSSFMPSKTVRVATEETCVDDDKNCEKRASKGHCDKFKPYTSRRCRKTCKVCATDCYDAIGTCKELKADGQCNLKGPEWQRKNCKKTCNMCVCRDSHAECEEWARAGECYTNDVWMQIACRKSCGTCAGYPLPEPEGCVDVHQNCPMWSQTGQCEFNPRFMHWKCKESCKTCEHKPCVDYVKDCDIKVSAIECRESETLKRECRLSCGWCKKDGYYEDSLLDLECYDKDPRAQCLAYAAAGKCGWRDSWGDWMKENCAFTCKVCRPTNQSVITESFSPAPNKSASSTTSKTDRGTGAVTENKTTETKCEDKSVACPLFAKQNRCHLNDGWGSWMRRSCRVACGLCGTEEKDINKGPNPSGKSDATSSASTDPPKLSSSASSSSSSSSSSRACKNDDFRCYNYAYEGYCQLWSWMKEKCRRSCGLCGGRRPPCVDEFDFRTKCRKYAEEGKCERFKWMNTSCPRSCKKCRPGIAEFLFDKKYEERLRKSLAIRANQTEEEEQSEKCFDSPTVCSRRNMLHTDSYPGYVVDGGNMTMMENTGEDQEMKRKKKKEKKKKRKKNKNKKKRNKKGRKKEKEKGETDEMEGGGSGHLEDVERRDDRRRENDEEEEEEEKKDREEEEENEKENQEEEEEADAKTDDVSGRVNEEKPPQGVKNTISMTDPHLIPVSTTPSRTSSKESSNTSSRDETTKGSTRSSEDRSSSTIGPSARRSLSSTPAPSITSLFTFLDSNAIPKTSSATSSSSDFGVPRKRISQRFVDDPDRPMSGKNARDEH